MNRPIVKVPDGFYRGKHVNTKQMPPCLCVTGGPDNSVLIYTFLLLALSAQNRCGVHSLTPTVYVSCTSDVEEWINEDRHTRYRSRWLAAPVVHSFNIQLSSRFHRDLTSQSNDWPTLSKPLLYTHPHVKSQITKQSPNTSLTSLHQEHIQGFTSHNPFSTPIALHFPLVSL